MKWKKMDKIFDPRDHHLADNCTEFAKSPQAIIFDDYVRIYFSSQRKTENGKYLSHPQYVDMDKSFENILNVSTSSIIELGERGAFDEHGIFPINVLRDNDKLLAYTSGWSRRVSVSIDMSIGLATSVDGGRSFTKYGSGPILTASLHEPCLVGDPFVKKYKETYHMWYIYGTGWKQFNEETPERIYKIAHATSKDAVNWQRDSNAIIEEKYLDESQALPTVIEINGRYHMFFCYRQSYDFRDNKNNSYRIGYAYSDDMKNWIRDDANAGIDVSDGQWDSDMLCYPNVFKCDGNIYMLYNGNKFGKFGFGLAILDES